MRGYRVNGKRTHCQKLSEARNRAWRASGSGDVGGELGMVFGLCELVAEGGGLVAVALRVLAVLDGADGADGVEDFAHGIVGLAGVFELVG